MNNDEQTRDTLTFEQLHGFDYARLHILRRVSPEAVLGLLEHCEIVYLDKGDVLLEKGQANQVMYLLLNGELSVHLDNEDSEPVAFLESGQSVGEISVIDDSPATAFVKASRASRLMAVDEDTFWRLVDASHAFSKNLLRLLASRLRANNVTIEESFQQKRILETEALVDALTGLRNRRWLDPNLNRLVARHVFSKAPLSLIMLDIDHFKKYNDDYGHAAGDKVLSEVAKTVMLNLRPTDLAARYGGEEFCVMLPQTDIDGGIIASNRIRHAVSVMKITCDGRSLPPVTVSLGVAQLNEKETGEGLLARADMSLYKAKRNGRNQVMSSPRSSESAE